MIKHLRRIKKVLKSPLLRGLRLELIELAKIDVTPLFTRLAIVAKLGFRFVLTQIMIRPRLKLAMKLILVLSVIFQLSSVAVSAIKPHEAKIEINGHRIIVAQEPDEQDETVVEISQEIDSKLSPFEFRSPIEGTLSQGYHGYHRANDIAGPSGTPIHPVGAGTVEFAGRVNDGKGNIVIIDHGDGLKSLYAHMGRIDVGVGNTVDTKAVIGTVGLTGRTTGPHVHLEIYDHDVAVNPGSVLPENTSGQSDFSGT